MSDEGSYDVEGPVGGLPIVFVHGTRLTRTMWRPQMEDLRDAYRVIAVDLPGHGALADQHFTVSGAADQVARVIEEAGGGGAVVVGLSLGGYVAIDLAARRPGLVRGLVVSGASREPAGRLAAPFLALAWVMDHVDRRWLETINAWFFRTRFAPAIADPIIAGGFWSAAGAEALRALVDERFGPRLAAYPGPTLIMNGDRDVFFRLSAKGFGRAAQDRRSVRLRGATHLANLDRPAAFSLAVRRFVEGLPAPEPSLSRQPADRPGEGPVLDLGHPSRLP